MYIIFLNLEIIIEYKNYTDVDNYLYVLSRQFTYFMNFPVSMENENGIEKNLLYVVRNVSKIPKLFFSVAQKLIGLHSL